MNEAKKVTKRKKRKINKIITILLLVTILIFFSVIFYINIIPVFYTILALILALVITFILVIFNLSRKKGFRIIGYFFSVLIISTTIFIETYLFNTLGFLFNATDGDYTIRTYNILVLNDSNMNDIKNLDNETIGMSETIEDNYFKKIQNKLNKKIDYNYEKYDDSEDLVEGIFNKEIDGIILENSEIELLKEQNKEKYELLKSIYQIEIKNDITDLKAAVNINKEPFNVYISGIDTYGKINSSSRSDVNMIVTVNPKIEKILITWIPRDYYISINSSSYKDKLTHAGIYGIDSSIYAIENLLDIDINYYVKVNFTSVINVVDILGGVNIYNDEAFTSIEGTYFEKGNLHLNGNDTLTFVRERKNLSEGDIGRGKNQIKVLEALMNKAMSPSIIKSYNGLLKSLDGAFITNMSHNTMLGFIRKEIQSPRNWQIESLTLNGTDSYEYSYTYKNKELYVMVPKEDSVKEAQDKIKLTMKNQK